MGQISFFVRDHTNERTSFSLPTSDLTAANIDSEFTEALAVQTALAGVCLGNIIRRNHQAVSATLMADAPAADEQAQREAKAMMIYHDSITFEPGRAEIPCIDLTQQLANSPGVFYDVQFAGQEDPAWGTFVTAVEATTVGPGGNAVVVTRIYHIGKAN